MTAHAADHKCRYLEKATKVIWWQPHWILFPLLIYCTAQWATCLHYPSPGRGGIAPPHITRCSLGPPESSAEQDLNPYSHSRDRQTHHTTGTSVATVCIWNIRNYVGNYQLCNATQSGSFHQLQYYGIHYPLCKDHANETGFHLIQPHLIKHMNKC